VKQTRKHIPEEYPEAYQPSNGDTVFPDEPILYDNFEEPQLWGIILEYNFGEQLSAATLRKKI